MSPECLSRSEVLHTITNLGFFAYLTCLAAVSSVDQAQCMTTCSNINQG